MSGLRRVPLQPGKGLQRGTTPIARYTKIRQVSAKRARENQTRRQVIADLYGGVRPRCERPGCTRLADDVHEPLTRARGGSITDRENMVALCRTDHDALTFRPESELGWAYELGLLVHSWDASGG